MARYLLIGFLNLLPATAFASRAVMEQLCANGCAIFVDTQTGRVDIATGTYSGGVSSIGLYVASNVAVGLNGCTIYSTGTLNCPNITQGGSPSNQWTTSGSNIYNNNSGNIGIKDTAPGNALSVNGIIASTGPFLVNSGGNGFQWDQGIAANSRKWSLNYDQILFGDMSLKTGASANASPTLYRLYINPSGNIGLGDTTPGNLLSVPGVIASSYTFLVDSGGNGEGLKYLHNAAAASREWRINIDQIAFGDFAIRTSATQGGAATTTRIYIDPSGNVGINTTSLSYLFDVNGGARISSTTQMGWERIVNNVGNAATATATCSVGKIVLSGGCKIDTTNSPLVNGFPPNSTQWECDWGGTGAQTNATAYAICARMGSQ